LEHVHKPDVLLTSLKNYLSDSGYLIIAVPNRLSFDARIFQNNWVAYDAPRHLYHFRPQDMQTLLQSAGFKLISFKGLHFDPWYNSLLSVFLEAGNKSVLKKIILLAKGLAAASLASIQGMLNKKKNSSVIYIAKPNTE
jgi:2-polyprenyl-3-methyl-5-hydroxy-6-metoxy-1,4-benzoquinol methylase